MNHESSGTGNPMIAITREPSHSLGNCELTHLDRKAIDVETAALQHQRYEQYLEQFGCSVVRLPAEHDLPDAVFVEDAAVVFPDVAVITRPGAESRRPETVSMADELKKWRPLRFIDAPGTLDGGDVLTLGKNVYVGISGRSNESGIEQLRHYLKPFGYTVTGVPVRGCLHLKTALDPVHDDLLLINPQWVDPGLFDGVTCVPVHPSEPFGANLLRFGNAALCSESFPRTIDWLAGLGLDVRTIDYSEMAKAEAGLTCCSVIFEG
ncbi:MAG: dimethylarginine dimethylaminohydrolase family protein [Cyclonatronaceae bacterium]